MLYQKFHHNYTLTVTRTAVGPPSNYSFNLFLHICTAVHPSCKVIYLYLICANFSSITSNKKASPLQLCSTLYFYSPHRHDDVESLSKAHMYVNNLHGRSHHDKEDGHYRRVVCNVRRKVPDEISQLRYQAPAFKSKMRVPA